MIFQKGKFNGILMPLPTLKIKRKQVEVNKKKKKIADLPALFQNKAKIIIVLRLTKLFQADLVIIIYTRQQKKRIFFNIRFTWLELLLFYPVVNRYVCLCMNIRFE